MLAVGGRKALREVWPAVLACGVAFAGVQFFVSNYIGAPLTDILSSLSAIAALIILLSFWHPSAPDDTSVEAASFRLGGLQHGDRGESEGHIRSSILTAIRQETSTLAKCDLLLAWTPYILLVLFVLAWGLKPVQQSLNSLSINFAWPALHKEIQRMPPVMGTPSPYPAVFTLNWLSAAGTSCMFAVLASAAILRLRVSAFLRLLISVARQLFLPTVTIASVFAMAFVMNYCGATGTLGLAFAATGAMFPFFSSLLGWLGVFLTGSDTSANALFGNLQVVTAHRLGFGPILIAASNSAGGVMGKMISLQSIAVAAAATGLSVDQQSKLFRFALRHSLLLAAIIGLEVLVYAYTFHMN